jgi:hypothetical protein
MGRNSMGKCYNTVTVKASSDEVWKTLRDFHDLSWAEGVVTSCEAVGETAGDTVGAKRILNRAFHETLLSLSDGDRTLSYSIDDGPGPVAKDAVSNYVGTVRVSPSDGEGNTRIEWESTYESPDEAAVGEFCNPIYQALLAALAKKLS